MNNKRQTRIAVDIGGTFTDIALDNGSSLYTAKTLTTRDDPVRGVIDVIRIASRDAGCAAQSISSVIHGTTLATNALIERKGARVGLITTAGFRDIIEIAYERRYEQYDIFIDKPDLLVTREDCWTVPERVDASGQVLEPLDTGGLDALLQDMDERGVASIAICLLHSYVNPAHEIALRDLIHARRPDVSITLSSEVCPEIREFDRACTALANAYIKPLMSCYLTNLSAALVAEGITAPLLIVTSGGGMTTLNTATRFPIRLVESGPSGGAVLAARIARECDIDGALSFDMGGTTAKLCLIDQGVPQRSRQFEIGRAARFVKGSGLPVRIPVVEMIEIGAGGGSIARIDKLQRLVVGPDSASSDPGPACYGLGGVDATVTDADVALGFIEPKSFAEGRVRLYPQAARSAIGKQIGAPLKLSARQGAYGISQMVDESMSNAARVHAAESVKHFLRVIPAHTMRPGDTYMTNDPWLGSGHLNDFVLVQPCFHRRKLVGLVSCTSHLIDLGGLGMGPDGSDVYDEGLIIPPIRLVEAGVINDTLMTLVKANSRTPFQNEGDIYALIACCDVAHARLDEMMGEFGISSLAAIGRYIREVSHKASVAAIDAAPQGNWQNRMMIDGYDFEIELAASLTIANGAIDVDFAGSSGCSRFGINVPLNYATAYSVFGLRCIFAPEVPNNAGSLATFRISAPPGCIVNATRPVPVAQRHIIGQLLPDVVLGCLRQAMPNKIPAEGSSCMYDLPIRGGFDATSGNDATRFAVELTHNGGTGARPGKDGLSATAFPSGVYGSQVEVTESTAPLLLRRRELRPDSGGAGRYRGGLGQIIEVQSREDMPFDFFGTVDRVKYPARGCFGGKDGAPGHLQLASGKLMQGKGKQQIPAGEVLVFQTPGGGGYGDPHKRPVADVARDYAAGLISKAALKRDYGVLLKSDGAIDGPASREQRCKQSR